MWLGVLCVLSPVGSNLSKAEWKASDMTLLLRLSLQAQNTLGVSG